MSTDVHETAVQRLAGFATECRDGGVPDDISACVCRRVIDLVGVCLGSHQLGSSQAVVDMVGRSAGSGAEEGATVIGRTRHRFPVDQAAFVNGVLAHSLDYDDTHLPSVLHPSASVVPAALAVGEVTRRPGADVVHAIAAGLEIVVRLGMAGYDPARRNSLFFEYGQHATSICGAVGAAAASALLLGLNSSEVAHAMAIAVSFAGGVLEGNRTGGTVKRLHCGWAATGGVRAAQLAAVGMTGPPTVLEGRFGFYQAYLRGWWDEEELLGGLATRWSVPQIFVKPYPANHFTHAGIDAAMALRAGGLAPEDVVDAELAVAGPVVRTIGEPIEDKRRPETGYQAQFSGPYTVAAALFGGEGLGLGLRDFSDDLARDPARRALMERIRVTSDPICDEIFPTQFPAILRVRTRDGRGLEERVLTTRGGPQRPLSDEELSTKLIDNARAELSPRHCQDLVAAALELPRANNVCRLLSATDGASAGELEANT